MNPWRGKWALVTGASAGIGSALANELAAGGTNLVLTARRRDRLTELADRLSAKHGIRTRVYAADLTKAEAPREIFAFTQENHLQVELLVNNAGFGAYGEFYKTDLHRLIDMVQVNVSAVVQLTHLYLPDMIARHSGDILIVSSTAAFQPVPYISTYAATKGFDLQLAEGLAEEVRVYGVRVCALCPGSTESEFLDVAGQSHHTRRPAETAQKVARVGLEALAAGKSSVISGFVNWLGAETTRFVPRRIVTRITGNMFRQKKMNRELNAGTDSGSLERQLHGEGFLHTYVWQDGANAFYPDHTHTTETAHIVLDGEMTLTQDGSTQTFRAGERCDVPRGAVHSARMGPHGCRYLIGEK